MTVALIFSFDNTHSANEIDKREQRQRERYEILVMNSGFNRSKIAQNGNNENNKSVTILIRCLSLIRK